MKRILLHLFLLLLSLPLFAHAGLPRSSSVPGGVAIIPLGKAVADARPPQVWLGEQPVLVMAERGKWYAVVGLALTMKPGKHTLRVMIGDLAKTRDFNIRSKRYPRQDIMMKDKSKVQLSPENAERAGREIATILKLKLHWRETQDTDPALLLPAEGQLGGRFGMRRYFNGEARAPHAGLDVAVPAGTPVMASSHGQVLAVDDYFFNGKTVFIDHGNGLITMYCHLDRIDVQTGDVVGKGQPIGLSGMTGRATGPHLHWSVVLNGAMVDPELFIPPQQARGGN
ncbi:MAG: peptidoglycan DD-metalloendopeptidase family protein [Gammaproteobacteria bacterium]|nr:peptidoglycan DD-metalloendopeptidase family protein [Gammaproteobacteria bacterium]MBU1777417.1 peptidoglycan DD-metalloendopeptidase family protein [Gammaproteobacteria bacterium]MBU1969595.1 peptidoglycan DD-metalloendopeptidase family protein [Gammaproteobacteria bacterium]